MEPILIVLVILTIVMMVQVFSLKRAVRSLQQDTSDSRSRLRQVADEIKALLVQVGAARDKARPAESTPAGQPKAPPAPVTVKPILAPCVPPPPASEATVAAPGAQETERPSTAPLPSAPPAAERKVPEILLSVREILKRIWAWILVGEEFRPAGMTMEYAVATTWLMRAGIVALVTCVAYFLKWSMDNGLLGPQARVGISIFVGSAMLAGGMRLQGRRWNILGQGFLGGGLATLYFSMFAAGSMYKLLPIPAAFALMILVTVTAGLLAIRTDSMLAAIFGIIGGFCTPIMLKTAQPNLVGLYSYMLLLGLGILGVSHYKQWRLLNYLGFVFTYALFFASLSPYHRADFPTAITFLSLFFVVQSASVYLYNISRAVRTTVLEIVHLILNSAIYSITAYYLIRDAAGRPFPAIMTLALAAFFLGHIFVFLRRNLIDRPLLISLISLAGLYAALTMPLALEKESLTICWALMAFMFLWLGGCLNSHFVRQLGYVMYGIVFWRLLCLEMPRDFQFAPSPKMPLADYWKGMLQRLWTFGISIISIFAAFYRERKRVSAQPAAGISSANDTPDLVTSSVAVRVFFWSVVVFLFFFLQLELYTMFGYFKPLRPAVLTFLWCAWAVFFLVRYRAAGGLSMRVTMCVFLIGAAVKTVAPDMLAWNLTTDCLFNAPYSAVDVLGRWLDFGLLLAALMAACVMLRERGADRPVFQFFAYSGVALLFLYLSLEVNSLLHWKWPAFQSGGISVLWTLFALAFVSTGIWKTAAPLRYAGLVLFAIVVGKVFLVDLSSMAVIYRVIAFMIVGVLLLLGSFAYLYASRKFKEEA